MTHRLRRTYGGHGSERPSTPHACQKVPSRPATTSHVARAPSGSSTHTDCSSEAWKNTTQMSRNASCLLLPRDASLDSTSFRAHAGGVPAWCSGARQSANCLATIRDRTALSSFRWRQRRVLWDCGEVDTMGFVEIVFVKRIPKATGKRRPTSATQPVGR